MTDRSRDEVLRSVERLLLDLMAKREPNEHPRRAIERHRLDARQLRRQALALVMRLPRVCSETAEERSAWVALAQAEVERLGLELPEGKSVAKSLPSPRSHQWSRHLRAPVAPDLPWSTIHEAKGREFEAVCVVLPPDRAPDNRTSHLLDAWENRQDDEAKRVIYVGVTRAKKVVMLAVPEVFVARCSALLARSQVPYELRRLPSSP
jgi:ATP-dependent exoDNAse (exonuclease V) beta subunit